jgi:alkylation response protein AidB-like acyl-CoA dehydrogenase
MDWKDTPEQKAFREDVRTFIQERFPKHYCPEMRGELSLEPEDVDGYEWVADARSNDPERRQAAMAWAADLAARGWVAPHWPIAYGGAGLDVIQTFILQEEMMRARVPTVNGIGVFLAGPTLLAHGTEAQRQQHLPPIARGEETWAQGFSEPDSGSDLASLHTRAQRDGDHYVVNGQKIWTSQAPYADWLMVLVRTDPDAPRPHRGITYLMVEAKTPGVTISPIEDVRGATPFAEMFFDNVRVPVENRVGEENRGWYVAMATLGYERSGIGAVIRYEQRLRRLMAFVKSNAGQRYLRPDWRHSIRHEIAQRMIEIRVLYNLALHSVSQQLAGEAPDYEASINQLFSAELHQRLSRTGAKAFGPYGNLWQRSDAPLEALFAHDWVGSIAATFLGGSAEIQRNVIATRGLGLPRGET